MLFPVSSADFISPAKKTPLILSVVSDPPAPSRKKVLIHIWCGQSLLRVVACTAVGQLTGTSAARELLRTRAVERGGGGGGGGGGGEERLINMHCSFTKCPTVITLTCYR